MMPPSSVCSTKPNLRQRGDGAHAQRRQRAPAGRSWRLLLRREELPAAVRGAAGADHAGDHLQRGADHRADADVRDLPTSTSASRARPARTTTGCRTRCTRRTPTPPYGQYNSPLSIDNLQTAIRTPFATAQKWFMTQLVTKVVSVLATTDDPAAPGNQGPRQHPHLPVQRDRRRAGSHAGQRYPLPADARQPPAGHDRQVRRARSRPVRWCSSRSRRRTWRRWSTGPPPICT